MAKSVRAKRTAGKLTAMFVARTGEAGLHGDGAGLWLRVRPSGSKTWVFRFSSGGNERYSGLGSFPAVTLEGARQKAAELKRQVVAGIDPIEAKEARAAAQAQARAEAAEATTFEMVGREYFEAHSAKWSNEQHRKDWVQSLRDHCGPIHDIPIDKIDTDAVVRCLKPIWSKMPTTASRVRGRIEQVLNYAAASGERPA